MTGLKCKYCGGITNVSTSYGYSKDGTVKFCFVKWVNGLPVRGCSYDKIVGKSYKKFLDDILEGKEKIK